MLLAVLIYAYSHGVRSSRAIERLCGRDAGYRFLVGEHVPDHTVIARFRRRHVERLEAVFIRVLEMCRDAGLIRLGLVVLDGTKVKANAALEANRSAATIGEQVGAHDGRGGDHRYARGPAVRPGRPGHAAEGPGAARGPPGAAARLPGEAGAPGRRRRSPAAGEDRGPGGRGAGHRQAPARPQAQAGRRQRRSGPCRQPDRSRQRHHEDAAWLGAGLQRPGGGDAASRSSSPPR